MLLLNGVNMSTRITVSKFSSLAAVLALSACTGTTDLGNGNGGGAPCTVTPGQVSTASYTIAWDAIVDADLANYKIYYSVTSPLTKLNNLGTIDNIAPAAMPSVTIAPADFGATTCTRVYIGVAAVGSTKPESALSVVQSVTIE